uniref:Uncharacterized protein n=1 Tax=Ciona savignyi TaxID=51511 RepID=H2YMK9_CIOSA
SQKPKPALKPHVAAKPTSSTLQSERERSVSELPKTTSFPTKHSGSLKIPFKPRTESPEHPETSSDHPKLSES